LINLAKPNLILAVIAGVSQYFQSKMITPQKSEDSTQKMMNKALLFFPILTISFGAILPAALPLYWTITTFVAILQQYLVMHKDVDDLEHPKNGEIVLKK